jgi:hypothetical protein
MAAISAMTADTTYPVSCPTSDPPESGRHEIGGHEHSGETQHHEKIELHRFYSFNLDGSTLRQHLCGGAGHYAVTLAR